MSVIEDTSTVWVVLDDADEVVVMAAGAGARDFAVGWAERGYRIVELGADEVVAA